MRIAVASHDGRDVASAPEHARYLLVFPVTDNAVGEPEVRAFDVTPELSAYPVLQSTTLDASVRIVPFPTVAAPAADEAADLPDEFLRAMLDCEVVVARTMNAVQRETCVRLGMLPLTVDAAGDAAYLVRFVVSGAPPSGGSNCSGCASPHPVLAAGPVPVA
ncbi:MAG: hypothetical protein KIT83_17645 [Bryobacterales bacterium]|nr:hypothetical protein [Bryobacterales bacterium]